LISSQRLSKAMFCQNKAMEKRIHDLASLLHPISLDAFFSTYWEKNFLLVPRVDEGYYEGLLTNKNLEEIISSPDARYPAIMLAKNGVYYPQQAYCEDVKMGHVTFSGVPNLKKLSAEYGKGATIALTSLDRSWRPLGDLCVRLEEQLDHGTNTNVYITAGQTTGFPPHYDTHDIMVLQIAGKKLWRLYEPTINLPDVSQPCEPKSFSPGRQLAEIELHAGDLLYLPRGYGHAATTSKSHSAHVTIGIHVYTWARILKERDPSCVRLEEFRKSLPPGFASRPELRPALKEQLKRMAPAYFTDGNLDRFFDSIVRNVNQVRRRMPGRFRADAIVISVDSLLKTPSEDRYHLSRFIDHPNSAAALTLDFDGNKYSFPAQLEAVLNAMCSRGSFCLKDLPGGVNREAIVDLAGYLQNIGFLTSIG
jgi:ribosomal protein L16 Arg81 hydroxylase